MTVFQERVKRGRGLIEDVKQREQVSTRFVWFLLLECFLGMPDSWVFFLSELVRCSVGAGSSCQGR